MKGKHIFGIFLIKPISIVMGNWEGEIVVLILEDHEKRQFLPEMRQIKHKNLLNERESILQVITLTLEFV